MARPRPNRHSKETGLLKEWPKDGPPLAWKVKDLGGGYSAPSVAAGRIFGMCNRGDDEVVWALDEKTGKELWTRHLGEAYKRQRMPQGKEGPACTPTIDGDLAYAIGLGGDLVCLRVTDGKVVWRKSLTADFGGTAPTWSYRESPLIDGDKVIVTPGGRGRHPRRPQQEDRRGRLEGPGAGGRRGGLLLGDRHRLRRAAAVRPAPQGRPGRRRGQ